ncbi:MAG TPA: hypothetical protein VFZ97_06625 [Acidimicrobiales bacterium]
MVAAGHGFLRWLDVHSGALQFFAALVLVAVTAVYVVLTRGLVEATKREIDVNQQLVAVGRTPILTVEVTPQPFVRSDGTGLGHLSREDFYATGMRLTVQFAIFNHGPGPAMVNAFRESERGSITFSGRSGPIMVPEGQHRNADWTHYCPGSEVAGFEPDSTFVSVRITSTAAADTGVRDDHHWDGTVLLTLQGDSYPSGGSTLVGPPYTSQQRRFVRPLSGE